MISEIRRSFLGPKRCHIKRLSYYSLPYYPGSPVMHIAEICLSDNSRETWELPKELIMRKNWKCLKIKHYLSLFFSGGVRDCARRGVGLLPPRRHPRAHGGRHLPLAGDPRRRHPSAGRQFNIHFGLLNIFRRHFVGHF